MSTEFKVQKMERDLVEIKSTLEGLSNSVAVAKADVERNEGELKEVFGLKKIDVELAIKKRDKIGEEITSLFSDLEKKVEEINTIINGYE